MTTSDKVKLIQDLVKHYQELNTNFHQIYSLFGSADSKFCDSVWCAIDTYTDLVSQLIGDKAEWVSWYLHDNRCGKDKKAVIIKGRKIKIDSVKKLVKVIESWHE